MEGITNTIDARKGSPEYGGQLPATARAEMDADLQAVRRQGHTFTAAEVATIVRVMMAIERAATLAWREGREADANQMWRILGGLEYHQTGFCAGADSLGREL